MALKPRSKQSLGKIYSKSENNSAKKNENNKRIRIMEKANIPPFQIGDKVVYITGKHMPKNTICKITRVLRWPCGCWGVHIDKQEPKTLNAYANNCLDCGKDFPLQHLPDVWCASSFRKVSEQPIKRLTFSEIEKVEKEEVLTLN